MDNRNCRRDELQTSKVPSTNHHLQGQVPSLYIAHKDKLTRFGFDLIDYLAKQNNCKIIIANQEQLTPEKEMVEDLMAIIHTFSCIYGLRKYKKLIKDETTK